MGKRVNFSGRSVISPDPLLDIDEVGVPEQMAINLTIQEIVNDSNIHQLSERVSKGARRIDGCFYSRIYVCFKLYEGSLFKLDK